MLQDIGVVKEKIDAYLKPKYFPDLDCPVRKALLLELIELDEPTRGKSKSATEIYNSLSGIPEEIRYNSILVLIGNARNQVPFIGGWATKGYYFKKEYSYLKADIKKYLDQKCS